MKKDINLLEMKKSRGEKIVSLTAYDYMTARLEEEAGVDFILVGDSMAMVVFGEETTIGADIDVMIAHTKAVSRGAANTLVVGDMPFGSYENSDTQAVKNAVRFISEGGADAVKLEGGQQSICIPSEGYHRFRNTCYGACGITSTVNRENWRLQGCIQRQT